jgi:peptidyl-prolyl cis-trans isomerase B (cyclophilin B)
MKIFKSMFTKHYQVAIFTLIMLSMGLYSFTRAEDDAKVEMVVLSTIYGDMTIMLYDDTPLHKENFLKLVEESYYDSLLFHRVISGFMIQGGDPNSKNAPANTRLGNGGPGYTIPAEFNANHIHKKGALSAARQGDAVNPEKESSGSQFYIVQGKPLEATSLSRTNEHRAKNNINYVPYTEEQIEIYSTIGGTPHLDGEYTVFGEVIDGLNVIDSIAAMPVDRANRPYTDIVMTMTIVKRKQP